MRTLFIIVVGLIIALGGVIAYQAATWPSNTQASTICPMDARLCPDGSYVGRVGPDCQFAECSGNLGGSNSGAPAPNTVAGK
ncbi:MAG: hypothetical protein KGI79_02100 [Patescibacteria group bacterium]|nr:hypothetical protein [Patescibacteria group bacterium]MDE2116643.1 hypothetical protein [Patescibacteria group bacterium]